MGKEVAKRDPSQTGPVELAKVRRGRVVEREPAGLELERDQERRRERLRQRREVEDRLLGGRDPLGNDDRITSRDGRSP